jgi:hypothetical protein
MTQYLPAASTAREFPGVPFEEWKLPAAFPK